MRRSWPSGFQRQCHFNGNAKAFVRTCGFLSAVLPYSNAGWEKRSIFLNLLVPKLPAREEPDLAKGTLDAIDLESYRVEKPAVQKLYEHPSRRRNRTRSPCSGGPVPM